MYRMVVGSYSLEGMKHVGYGISGENVTFVDITCDKSAMQQFIELCNREQLEGIHLAEVIEDFWL